MPSDRKPNLILPVVVTLAVLLGLYVGAYYAMVHPHVIGSIYGNSVVAFYSSDEAPLGPERERWCQRIFAPIHRLDRHIRPHIWEPE